MSAVVVAIPAAPLAVAGILGAARGRGRGVAAPLAIAGPALSLVAASAVAAGAAGPAPGASVGWFAVGRLEVELALELDALSTVMAILVAALCVATFGYAAADLRDHPRRHVFFAWMSAFAGSMLALVLAHSLVLLVIAWEAVGVASYALIAFRHRERAARGAARRAFVVTRLGDLALLVAAVVVLVTLGGTRFGPVIAAAKSGALGGAAVAIVGIGLVVAATAKSAQLPLSAWLPDAMVAPTAVSALLHSATMVAAGVYVLVRFEPLLAAAPLAGTAALWIGAITAPVAALAAASAADLKRVLAWSTVSQLGEMMVAVGHGSPGAATLHLIAHALFKAALFLVAGSIDRRAGTRELARLGGLARRMPLACAAFAVAALSLAGVPPLAGFVSEEAILGSAAAAGPRWAVHAAAMSLLAGAYIGRAGAAVFAPWPGAPSPRASGERAAAAIAWGALAAAAAGFGAAFAPIGSYLPQPAAPSPPGFVAAGAVLAGLVGLGTGALRVMRTGPAPAFGRAAAILDPAIRRLVTAPGRATLATAAALRQAEAALDAAARRIAAGAGTAARSAGAAERLAFDSAARATAAATVASARRVVAVERGGLHRGGDATALSLSVAGEILRGLESGKLYLYVAGLVVSLLVVAALLVIVALI